MLAIVAAAGGVVAIADSASASAKSKASTAKKSYTIGLASEGLNAPFPVAIAKGAKAAAAKDGVKLIVTDAKLTESNQETDIRSLIAEHVNGLIIDVIDPGPTTAMIKLANAAHIPVMLVHGYAGSGAKPVYPGVKFEVVENYTKMGQEAGQLAIKADPSGGQVAIITGTPGYQAVTMLENGFKSVIGPTHKFQVVATQPGNWVATDGNTACASILQAHPQVSLFMNESDDMAIGCEEAVKAHNSKAKVVSSIGGTAQLGGMIKQGSVYGFVCDAPATEGSIALTAMYDQLSGKKHYNRTLDYFPTPAVTRSNISTCHFQW